MSRRPRIDLAGFHHVINRGINRANIYEDDADYEMFLKIVCKACRSYRVVLHDYCLMSNHFHLLVETELENLSLFMKQINSNYAIYFNKKTKRTGHFWQGRFYSRYIANETYYYTLIRYIEQNPIEAGIVSKVGEYPYTLGSVIMNKNKPVACANKSKLIEELSYKNIQEMIGVSLDDEALKALKEIEMQKVVTIGEGKRVAKSKELSEYFTDKKDKIERNSAIIQAIEDGYTQAEVARYIGLSRSALSKIVKSVYSTPDPEEGSGC
jgi:REP element-mobilizing transposase RayT/DNA-binding CsgD family transcriptional regulator